MSLENCKDYGCWDYLRDLREIPKAIKNIPINMEIIITKKLILFAPFKTNYSIMTVSYFQIMSYSNNGSVKFFVHFKK